MVSEQFQVWQHTAGKNRHCLEYAAGAQSISCHATHCASRRRYYAFILLTGCRWSEAAQLTWDCVTVDSWHVSDPKNHNPVSFPISKTLCALLDARPHIEGNPYVFSGCRKADFIKDACTVMNEVSKLAGRYLTHHDLR